MKKEPIVSALVNLGVETVSELSAFPLGSIIETSGSALATTATTAGEFIGVLPIGQVVEIMSIVSDKIITHIEMMVMNRRQMKSLAKRLQNVVDATKRLRITPTSEKRYDEPMRRLMNTVFECAHWVLKYSKKSFIIKYINSPSHHLKFQDLYKQIAEHVQDLQLGLNVQEWFDMERHQREFREDVEALKNNIADFKVQIRDGIDELVGVKLEGADRADVISKKMMAFNAHLAEYFEKQQEEKNAEELTQLETIDSRLMTHYCDLYHDKKLAEGSFGKIYKGYWGEQEVVIKEVDNFEDPDVKAEFLREVKILGQLRSPYIVQFYATCLEPGRACYIMEYMSEGDLTAYLRLNPELSLYDRHILALDIARGLVYLHDHAILHCDLKSENVLINAEGRAKLADFGLSEVSNKQNVPSLPPTKGSEAWPYLAPEVLLSKRAHSEKSEVYSFAMIFWAILAGKEPYASYDNKQNIIPFVVEGGREELKGLQFEPHYRELIESCWQEQPFKRPSMRKIVRWLESHRPEQKAVPLKLVEPALMLGPFVHSAAAQQAYETGLQMFDNKRYEDAMTFFTKASDVGHTKARTDLAMLHLQKLINGANFSFAKELLQQSAIEGHARAMDVLARVYISGGKGVAADQRKAGFWQSQAQFEKEAQKKFAAKQRRAPLVI